MPHKFLPPLFRGEKTITFSVPRGVSGGHILVEFGPEGFKDITPRTKLQQSVIDFEDRARNFELRDLDPTGDLFNRGAHANADIVIEESVKGGREFARLIRSIVGAFRQG